MGDPQEEALGRATRVARKHRRVPTGLYEPKDVVHENIINRLERGETADDIFDSYNSPKIYTIIRRQNIDLHRREITKKQGGPNPPVSLEAMEPSMIPAEHETPEEAVMRNEETDLYYEAIESAELTKCEKEVLELRIKGYQVNEIAQELGIKPSAVHSRQNRYRKKLCRAKKKISRKLGLLG